MTYPPRDDRLRHLIAQEINPHVASWKLAFFIADGIVTAREVRGELKRIAEAHVAGEHCGDRNCEHCWTASVTAEDPAAVPSALAARAAIERVRSVLESEAVVGRSALDYRGLITSALMADDAPDPSRMAVEAQQPVCPTPESHNWGCGCPGDRLPLYSDRGVDTPGCDCGHTGMGMRWHDGVGCAWFKRLTEEGRRLLVDDPADEAQQPETQAQPPRHRWYVEMLDDLADEWVPGTRYPVRERAVNHLNHASAIGPTWKDGTPVQRRLVRETTSYTVEPAAVSQPGKEA